MTSLTPLTSTAPVPTCADCGVARFSRKPKRSPYCRACVGRHNGQSPARRAKASASMKAHLSDPHVRATHIARATDGLRRRIATDPDFAAQRREMGRRTGLMKLGTAATPAGSPARVAAGKAVSATKLAWCPPEYRDEYKYLIRTKRIPAVEARQIILSTVKADAARYRSTGVLPQASRAERTGA